MTQAPPDLSLRDYFAGQALPILLDMRLTEADRAQLRVRGLTEEQATAMTAYRIADAMVAARATNTPAEGEKP